MTDTDRRSSLRPVEQDIEKAEHLAPTPQTESPAYRLAFVDEDFMCRDDLRPIRLQLELLKPEMILNERGIVSTVVMFGGARIPAPGTEPWAAKSDAQAEKLRANAKYYDAARLFARRVSEESLRHYGKEFVVVTGGGPGVMEAGNLGAHEVGAASIGLNIVLEHEQAPNAHVTPSLCFNFHYFAIRKMHFLMRAKAVTIFPGGFGTLDELFETLTLIQTNRMQRMPVVLFGESFWRRIVNLEALAEEGTISPEDLDLIQFAETADDGWRIIAEFYGLDT